MRAASLHHRHNRFLVTFRQIVGEVRKQKVAMITMELWRQRSVFVENNTDSSELGAATLRTFVNQPILLLNHPCFFGSAGPVGSANSFGRFSASALNAGVHPR